MTTLVSSRFANLERAYAACIGGASLAQMASNATEEQLRGFPPTAWCRSQEANVSVLSALADDAAWTSRLARAAIAEDVDRDGLERLVAQMFVMTWGRRLAAIRLAIALSGGGPVVLVSDLPRPLVRAFLREFGGRVVDAPIRSWPLRVAHAVYAAGRLAARHVVRIARLFRLRSLPRDAAGEYVAWLGALPSEVAAAGGTTLSLIDFMQEARAANPRVSVMLQGARPASLPSGMLTCAHVPALRRRPRWRELGTAVASHATRFVRDIVRAGDFQHATLIAPVTFDVPALRLWMRTDPPRAVMYANHQIGGEPPVALLRSGVPSTMVFYSANVTYRPVNINAPCTALEPEMRYIAADRLTMWSPEMTAAFATAGYAPERLHETGPIFFGTQAVFRPRASAEAAGFHRPVRIGVFDVVVLKPAVRFAQGLGRLTYNAEEAHRFFQHVFAAAAACFGGDVVIVRKMKRARHPSHGDDVDFAQLPPLRVEARDPAESLWRLLEQVDLVLCMPFTSVAYMADECGVPAAYYDAGEGAEPSPLGGRVPLLSGIDRLTEWLRAAPVPAARLRPRVASSVLAAATATLARAGDRFSFTETARECPSH